MENQADVQDLISQGIALMSTENYEAAKAVFQKADLKFRIFLLQDLNT